MRFLPQPHPVVIHPLGLLLDGTFIISSHFYFHIFVGTFLLLTATKHKCEEMEKKHESIGNHSKTDVKALETISSQKIS